MKVSLCRLQGIPHPACDKAQVRSFNFTSNNDCYFFFEEMVQVATYSAGDLESPAESVDQMIVCQVGEGNYQVGVLLHGALNGKKG